MCYFLILMYFMKNADISQIRHEIRIISKTLYTRPNQKIKLQRTIEAIITMHLPLHEPKNDATEVTMKYNLLDIQQRCPHHFSNHTYYYKSSSKSYRRTPLQTI